MSPQERLESSMHLLLGSENVLSTQRPEELEPLGEGCCGTLVQGRSRGYRGGRDGGCGWSRGECRGGPGIAGVPGAVPAAVPLHARRELDERPERAVYHQGEYHLFYQYNPLGQHVGPHVLGPRGQPRPGALDSSCRLAISYDDDEMIFSGSAVVDKKNTSGFGTDGNPPMVAIYTSATAGHASPGARLQPRRRAHVDEVRRQPRARHRLGRLPRPEGVLARADQALGHGGRRCRPSTRSSFYTLAQPQDLDPPRATSGPAGATGGVMGVPRPVPARRRRQPGDASGC